MAHLKFKYVWDICILNGDISTSAGDIVLMLDRNGDTIGSENPILNLHLLFRGPNRGFNWQSSVGADIDGRTGSLISSNGDKNIVLVKRPIQIVPRK